MTGPAGTLPPPSPSTRFTPAVPPPPPAGAPTRGVVGHLFRPLIEARTWKGTAHLLLNLFFGIVWFTLIITGLSVGFGSLITLIGIPVLIGTLLFGRVIGAVERARCRWLLDTAVASPFHPLGGTGSLWDRFKAIIGDGAAWKALAFGLISLPFGVLTFVVTVVLWSVGLTGVTFPLYGWALSQGQGGLDLGPAERVLISVVYGLLGLGVLVATPYLVRA
ncbi:MAG TPA: sensor domain-containing protein, partial [Acidimicrobiales bacterium]|nr:sensor domain-containing protein [Acidimicrobiales bacterium]